MELSRRQARATAELAYIFMYPLVAGYRSMYAAAVDRASPSFAGGLGRWIHHRALTERQCGAESAHLTTLWSTAWIDIRHEPCVLSLPAVEERSAHVVDLWGFADDVSGLVACGAPVLVANGRWQGIVPSDLSGTVRAETDVVRCDDMARPSGPADLEAARTFQQKYLAEPLSTWSGRTPGRPGAHVPWAPVDDESMVTMDFWSVGSFALSLTHPHDDDRHLLDRLAEIGVVAGGRWDPEAFDTDVLEAIADGMDDALTELMRGAGGDDTPTHLSRAGLERDYFARALAAMAGHDFVDIDR